MYPSRMPRKPRIQYPNATYHVISRGNRGQDIFINEYDYRKFLNILEKYAELFNIRIIAYCLMTNHFHLALRTPDANLSNLMHRLLTAYSAGFRLLYDSPGHLFQARYKALLVEEGAYLLELSRYIHLNPVRAGVVEKPEDYGHSSLADYVWGRRHPAFLEKSDIMSVFGHRWSPKSYLEYVYAGIGKELDLPVREAIAIGSPRFLERLRRRFEPAPGLESDNPPADDPQRPAISPDEILRAVAEVFSLESKEAPLGRARERRFARKAAIFAVREITRLSLREIGELFGVGPNAVSISLSGFKKELARSAELRRQTDELLKSVLSRRGG